MSTDDYRRGYQAGHAAGRRPTKPLKDLSKAKIITANWVGIDDFPHEDWECNACGFLLLGDDKVPEWAKFCPNCGADMRKHRKED